MSLNFTSIIKLFSFLLLATVSIADPIPYKDCGKEFKLRFKKY
jgi:hypothetical protein